MGGSNNNNNDGITMGGSIASSGAKRTSLSLPQHQLLAGTRAGNTVHGTSIITSNSDNDNHHDTIERGDSANNNKNKNRHRVRGRGDINVNTASLLPTGDEMLIDEMQEYLEP